MSNEAQETQETETVLVEDDIAVESAETPFEIREEWLKPVEFLDQGQRRFRFTSLGKEIHGCPTPNLIGLLGPSGVGMGPIQSLSLLKIMDLTCIREREVQLSQETTPKLGKFVLVTLKDLSNTLATSIKQLQDLHVLVLDYKMSSPGEVEVNGRNAGGLTALDILENMNDVKMIDMKLEDILRRAGGLRARDIKSQPPHSSSQVVIDCETALNQQFPSPVSHKFQEAKIDSPSNVPTLARNAMFLVATMIATVTYLALNSGAWKEVYSNQSYQNSTSQPWKQNLEFKPIAFTLPMSIRLFAAFNSAGFFTSIAMMVVLISGFPLRPLLLVAAFSLLVSYMCLITAMLPTEVVFVLILTIPVVSFAVTQYIFPRGKWGSGNLLKLKWRNLGKLNGL